MRSLDPDRLIQQLQRSGPRTLDPLYMIQGDEILLVNETVDALRSAARADGYTERVSLVLDARSDWSAIQSAVHTVSLFEEQRIVEIAVPSGRPGRPGGDALQTLASQAQGGQITGAVIILTLPRLERTARTAKWAQALANAATTVEVRPVERPRLPRWIHDRLARQDQQVDPDTLEWLADRVEGNLLAAHQEIQKLALLYPAGTIAQDDVQRCVLDVARYNVFVLRDAMLAGQAQRTLTILDGLRAEGEALPLVLWAIGDEVRTLARLAAERDQGDLFAAMRKARIFAARQEAVRRALDRIPASVWPAAVQHAHDIDRLIKGLQPKGRMQDPWAELARLALRIARGVQPQ